MRLVLEFFTACMVIQLPTVLYSQPSDLPSALLSNETPSGSKRLVADRCIYLYDDRHMESVDVGTIFTGVGYEIIIPFENSLGSALEITDVETSCGCMVGIRRSQKVLPGAKSDFAIFLGPQLSAGGFAKRITLKSSDGREWPVGIKAKILPSFELTPARIEIECLAADLTFDINVKSQRAPFERDFRLASATGFLTIIDQRVKNGMIEAECKVSSSAQRSLHTLTERLAIMSSKNVSLAGLELMIEPKPAIFTRPSRVVLNRSTDGTKFQGNVMTFGGQQEIANLSSGLVIEVEGAGISALQGVVELVSLSKRTAMLNITFETSRIASFLKAVGNSQIIGVLMRSDDREPICEIEELVFNAKGEF